MRLAMICNAIYNGGGQGDWSSEVEANRGWRQAGTVRYVMDQRQVGRQSMSIKKWGGLL